MTASFGNKNRACGCAQTVGAVLERQLVGNYVTEYLFLELVEMLGWMLHEKIAFQPLEFIVTRAYPAQGHGTSRAVAVGEAICFRGAAQYFR